VKSDERRDKLKFSITDGVAEKVAGRDSGRGGRGNRKSVEKLRLWLKCARSGKEG